MIVGGLNEVGGAITLEGGAIPPLPIRIDEIKVIAHYDPEPDLSYLVQDYNFSEEQGGERESKRYREMDKKQLLNYGMTWLEVIGEYRVYVSVYINGEWYKLDEFESGTISGLWWDLCTEYQEDFFESLEEYRMYEVEQYLTCLGFTAVAIQEAIDKIDKNIELKHDYCY